MSEVLSQEEIDALLEGVKNGDVSIGHHISDPDAEIGEFDLGAEDRIVRGRLPSMEMINQRFARSFAISAFPIFRRPIDIQVNELRMQKYAQYTETLALPSNINTINIPQLDATALIVLEQKLVYQCVDLFFGGTGDAAQLESKELFTPAELRVVQRILAQVFVDLKQAWEPVTTLDFSYERSEVNPRFANFFSPSEIVLITEFVLSSDDQELGRLDIMMSYSALEPFREALDSGLQSDQAEKHNRWRAALGRRMEDANVEVRSVLAHTKVKLRDLTRFKPGDVIPIEMVDKLTLSARDTPLFSAVFGTSKGSNAVRIVEPIPSDQRGST